MLEQAKVTLSRPFRETWMLRMMLMKVLEEVRMSLLEIRARKMDLHYVVAEIVSCSYVESRTRK